MAIKLIKVVLNPEKSRCYPVQPATECLPQESWRNVHWFAPLAFNFGNFAVLRRDLFWSAPVHVNMFQSFERVWNAITVLKRHYQDVAHAQLDWLLSSENNRTVSLSRHAHATKWQLSAIYIPFATRVHLPLYRKKGLTRSTSQGKATCFFVLNGK